MEHKTKKIIIIFFLILSFGVFGLAKSSWAATLTIPSDRRIDWTGTAGVPGGIPTRETNCTTSACNTLYGGSVSSATINAAITSAPVNTVVRIPSGTFALSSSITIYRNDVVLRGAGVGQTILNAPSNEAAILVGGYGFDWTDLTHVNITSGSTKGSQSIVVANPSTFEVGRIMEVSEDNESFMHDGHGQNISNLMRQTVIVTNKNGSNLSFSPPLIWDFSSSPVAVGGQIGSENWGKNIGLENFTISGNTNNDSVYFQIAYASWMKNVEISSFGSEGVWAIGSLNCTFQSNYIHGPVEYNEGYGIYLYGNSSSNLVENNRFDTLWAGVMNGGNPPASTGTTGNVIAYNYVTDNSTPVWTDKQVTAYNENHGGHGMFNLWEGNVGTGWQNDGYHGSASHATLFRNYFHGIGMTGYNDNRKMVDLDRFSDYHNVIGNVLGSSTWNPVEYQMTGNDKSYSDNVIYRLGYPNMGNNHIGANSYTASIDDDPGLDPTVQATLLRDLNYDDYTNSVISCGDATYASEGCQGATGTTLPDSLYYTSKPSWWCDESSWPPVNPNGANNSLRYSKIPAQIAYEGGTCTTGVSDTTPPASPTGLSVS